MTDSNGVRRLWGHDFRLVGGGLDESDVAAFVEGLLNQLQASVEKSEGLENLKRLALSALNEAERVSSEIRAREEAQAVQRPSPAAVDAEHLADEIIERAQDVAGALEAQGRRKAQQKVAEVAETLRALQSWAGDEFAKLRDYEERLSAFNTSFETFLALIGEGLPREEPTSHSTTPEQGVNIAEMPLLEDVKRASRESEGTFGDLPYSILDDGTFSSN